MCQECESNKNEEAEDKFKIIPIPESKMGKIKDFTGQKFGMLTCLGYAGADKKGYSRFVFLCDCGEKTIVNGAIVKYGSTKSCGCLGKESTRKRSKSSIGRRFGKLVVKSEFYEDSSKRCVCDCDCGGKYTVREVSLKGGMVKSCGCIRSEAVRKWKSKDSIGVRFGRLIVKDEFYKNRRKYCICMCDCGKEHTTKDVYLRNGKCKSCGCLREELRSNINRKDIKGERFGALVAVEPIGSNSYGVVWRCVCNCGKTREVPVEKLSTMKFLSCGECNRDAYDFNHSEKQELKITSNRMRKSVINSFKGKNFSKSTNSYKIVGCTPDEFRNHLKSNFSEGMTLGKSRKWHIDHRIPSSYAKTVQDLYYLNSYLNLFPMWGAENLAKNDKLPPDIEEKFIKLKKDVDEDRKKRGIISIQEILNNNK